MSENDRNVVRVLTAGGAASPPRKDKDPRDIASTTRTSTTTTTSTTPTLQNPNMGAAPPPETQQVKQQQQQLQLEIEESSAHFDFNHSDHDDDANDDVAFKDVTLGSDDEDHRNKKMQRAKSQRGEGGGGGAGGAGKPQKLKSVTLDPLQHDPKSDADVSTNTAELVWLAICFFGIMGSFVVYGLLLEYTTSGGRKLHELSFLFVTSGLYTLTAAAGRYVRNETPTTIPPARFAILGLTSMGSTWCSVRSLRYVIFPIQVLAKSCKPVPVMIMGTFMGKRYPLRKYLNVFMIVTGVAMFMGGGDSKKNHESASSSPSQMIGILLLFVSLCFDGGTGAYEDKLMSVHSVQPFDLMYNIQLGKTILAGVGLLVFNQLHIFLQMVQDMGFLLVALGLSGALGQVFIFVTIAKFGALTCSIIGLARKITTLVASIYFYGHSLNTVQFTGLVISVGSMIMNFMGKSKKSGGDGHHGPPPPPSEASSEELERMLDDLENNNRRSGNVELQTNSKY